MFIINLDNRQASQSPSRLLQNAQNSHTIMRGLATELETMTAENFENEAFGGHARVRKALAIVKRWRQTANRSRLIRPDIWHLKTRLPVYVLK